MTMLYNIGKAINAFSKVCVTGSSAWMMTRTWDFTDQVLLFAMRAVMMIGMMLPSATPTLFLYASVIPQESAERMRPPLTSMHSRQGYLSRSVAHRGHSRGGDRSFLVLDRIHGTRQGNEAASDVRSAML